MVHFNVRSLTNKFDDLIHYLNSFSFSFSLTALTETWLNESHINDETQIPGYRNIIVNRKHKKGGGVSLYIKDDFEYKIRNDSFIRNCSEDIGNIFIEIHVTTNQGKNHCKMKRANLAPKMGPKRVSREDRKSVV